MASAPDRNSKTPPFITRRSTIVFVGIFLAAYVALQPLSDALTSPTGFLSAVTSLVLATADVMLLLSWIAGMILAWRSRSLIWMLVACLPPPFGALGCAFFAPQGPPGSGTHGGRGLGGPPRGLR
jgi:hypothetical protein